MLSNLSLPWWAYALMGAGLCIFIALIAITIHRNRGMHRSLFASPYALWMMIFTIVPVILIAYYAFTDSSGAFTLDNFRSFWDSNYESNKIILDAMGEAGQAVLPEALLPDYHRLSQAERERAERLAAEAAAKA